MATLGRAKRLPLLCRFNAALTETPDARLRALSAEHGLSNNDLLTILRDRLYDVANPGALDTTFADVKAAFGALVRMHKKD